MGGAPRPDATPDAIVCSAGAHATEDVPFAVELRDGDPGLMFKQARA